MNAGRDRRHPKVAHAGGIFPRRRRHDGAARIGPVTRARAQPDFLPMSDTARALSPGQAHAPASFGKVPLIPNGLSASALARGRLASISRTSAPWCCRLAEVPRACPLPGDGRPGRPLWICFTFGLLPIGPAASADVIDVGQVCEPQARKARHAGRRPKSGHSRWNLRRRRGRGSAVHIRAVVRGYGREYRAGWQHG
jgi:hypothetical protein